MVAKGLIAASPMTGAVGAEEELETSGGHQQIESVEGEGGRSPREGGTGVVWEEASPAREGATPGGGCALVESHVQARVRAAEGGGGA